VLHGMSKGGLGGGGGGVSTPVMSIVIPPTAAAAIMLPVLCVMDLAGIKAYLGRWDRRILAVILPAGVAGCVLGALTFRALDENWIRILVGAIALAFLAYSLYPRKSLPARPSARAGGFWATVSGFTSFITHAGGPPLMVYLLPQRLEKAVFVATSLVYFAALNYVKILPYLWLGLFDLRNLATSAALLPAAIGGIYLGLWAQRRINTQWFYRVVYVLLFLTGSKLLYDGVTGL
jgi:uncharacterized membrane protein YfcA